MWEPLLVVHLPGVAACWSVALEGRLAGGSRLGVVRSGERGRQEQHAWVVAVPRALVWVRAAVVHPYSLGLSVEDAPGERLVLGYWLRCQGASPVNRLLAEREQESVWPSWALQELMEQRPSAEEGLTLLAPRALLELPPAWDAVWAQTVP